MEYYNHFYVFSIIRIYLFIFLTSWIFIPLLVFSLLRYSLLVTALLCLVAPIKKLIFTNHDKVITNYDEVSQVTNYDSFFITRYNQLRTNCDRYNISRQDYYKLELRQLLKITTEQGHSVDVSFFSNHFNPVLSLLKSSLLHSCF